MSESKNTTNISVLFNRVTWPWMASRSGYDLIAEYLEAPRFGLNSSSVFVPYSGPGLLKRRLLKPFYWKLRPHENHLMTHAWAETEVRRKSRKLSPDVIFYLVGDKAFSLGGARPQQFKGRLMATLHQPPAWWKLHHTRHEYLQSLEAIITMSSEQATFFREISGKPVEFIPHGVDTEYFSPDEDAISQSPYYLLVGHHLRDFNAVEKIVQETLLKDPASQFHLVVPHSARRIPELYRIARHPQCQFHANLSIEELRKQYRRATALVMPVIDATANNAVVEGLACGLPLIGSDCPGLKDYCSNQAGTFIPGNDPKLFVEAMQRLSGESQTRINQGREARTLAETKLAWPLIAKETYEVVKKVAGGGSER